MFYGLIFLFLYRWMEWVNYFLTLQNMYILTGRWRASAFLSVISFLCYQRSHLRRKVWSRIITKYTKKTLHQGSHQNMIELVACMHCFLQLVHRCVRNKTAVVLFRELPLLTWRKTTFDYYLQSHDTS